LRVLRLLQWTVAPKAGSRESCRSLQITNY